MRKLLGVFLIVFLCLFSSFFVLGEEKEQVDIDYYFPQQFYVGDQISPETNRGTWNYISEDNSICTFNSRFGYLSFLKKGITVLSRVRKSDGEVLQKYLIEVKDIKDTVSINGKANMKEGEKYQFYASSSLGKTITFSSSDDLILSVDENGVVEAKGVGLARIIATSQTGEKNEIPVIVFPKTDLDKLTMEEKIDGKNINQIVSSIVKDSLQSMVCVSSYMSSFFSTSKYDDGCGFIYKRFAHLLDGSIKEDDEYEIGDVDYYEYYLVTNKHLVTRTGINILTGVSQTQEADKILIYYGENETIEASIIAYDTKVDVCVLKFNSKIYFPTVKMGESSLLKQGDFVISIGTANGHEFYKTSTFGIVSAPVRYLSDDTDGDGTNDWDALYLQHDAAINSWDCGSPLFNLKGEVIGINTSKKIETSSGVTVENLSFAIPSDLLLELVPLLEQGIVPKRPTIGVTVLSILDILPNIKLYRQTYGYNIPDGLDGGFFVTDITPGGIAETAGLEIEDVILEFNDTKLTYMYELRALLDHYIVGSGATASLKVLRKGEEVILTLVF